MSVDDVVLTEDGLARVVHETMRAYARALDDTRMPAWGQAPQWMKRATCEAVQFRRDNPNAPPSAQHDQWMAQKYEDGWVYGTVKDAVAKTHPLLVPYEELPNDQRRKDVLIGAVINALVQPVD